METVLPFELAAPRRVVFGWGRRTKLPALARTVGARALLVSGSRALERSGEIERLVSQLASEGIRTVALAQAVREPLVHDVDAATERLIELVTKPGDFLLAIGGGSAIDLAKAVAAMATNREGVSVQDYLEGVGRGFEINSAPLPMIALPTTAGTGSEATKNAVISSHDPPFKKSLRSPRMVPELVIIDPELTVGVPSTTTAWTGMDAITQLIESFISRRATPITRALCLAGLEGALPALNAAVADGASRPARERMAQAAFLSGVALANSGLGMAHGVAAALGVHANIAHGLACAVMLPVALRANREVAAPQLAQLARVATGRASGPDGLLVDSLIAAVDELAQAIGVPSRLSDLGVRSDQVAALVRDSRGSSMNGNPRELSDGELADLLSAKL